MFRILVAGKKEFIDEVMRQSQENSDKIRVSSATPEFSSAVRYIEEKGDMLDAVLLGYQEDQAMLMIDVIEGTSLKIPVFVSEENPIQNRRKWMQYRVRVARAGKELRTISDYFGSRPEAVAKHERPIKSVFNQSPEDDEEFVKARVEEVARRERANRAVTVKQKVIAVFGNKGGVGKSAISNSMALSINQLTGLSVAVVDVDMNRNCGNNLSLFGYLGEKKLNEICVPKSEKKEFDYMIPERTVSAWSKFNFDRRNDRKYVEACLIKIRKDLYTLPPLLSIKDAELVDDTLVKRVVSTLQKHFDIVIIDAGNTLTNASVGALDICDELILVVDAAVSTIDSLLDFLTDTFNKIQGSFNPTLVVNRMFPDFPYKIEDIQYNANGIITREIPDDEKTKKMICCDSKVPYVGLLDTPFTRGIEELLVSLLGPDIIRGTQQQKSGGLFKFFKKKWGA